MYKYICIFIYIRYIYISYIYIYNIHTSYAICREKYKTPIYIYKTLWPLFVNGVQLTQG